MKTKKILTIILAMAILVPTSLMTVLADGIDIDKIVPMPMPTVPVIPDGSDYAHIDGIITDIKDYLGADGNPAEGRQIIEIKKGDSVWNAIIDSNTYYITAGKTNKKAMSVGDDIRVFYNAKAPMILIYPPQINAEFIALNLDEAKSVTIARFDLAFTSQKDSLKLNISKDTEIVYEDGKKYEGKAEDLLNPSRKLVVIYSITTRSIPAQTTPEKIIIMYEKAVMLPGKEDEFEQLLNGKIVVKGKTIDAPAPYYSNGILMLPVRAISETLGFDVNWDDVVKGVRLGAAINLWIGKDYYTVGRMAPIELGAAPELTNGYTYVPFNFFGEIVQGYDVTLYKGWVLIEPALARGGEIPEGVQIHD